MPQVLAATIFKANGPISVTREGKTITLKQGDSVLESDSINTGESSVELHFADGAKAVLGPQTTMHVEEFSMDAADPAFVLNLATGLMRTISGGVVEQNPDAFKVITPKATVGIRGTEFDIKIHQDGSETILLQQLDHGHNVVVTTHSGNQASLSVAAQGAHIPADGDASIEVKHFTPQEIEDLVTQLVNILAVDENEEQGETQTLPPTLELEQSLVTSVSDESLGDLLEALDDAGIDVTVATASDDDSLSPQEEVFVLPGDDDGDDAVIVGFTHVSISGAESYFADATPVHGLYGNQHITIEQNMLTDGVIISGDAQDITLNNTTVSTVDDSITGLNMDEGTVVGDAASLSGSGTFVAGNDTITFANKSGGDSIYGDVKTITGGNVSFGDDSIVITGTFSESLIAGDSLSAHAATVTKWGNDTIQIAHMTGGNLYGDDDRYDSTQGGADIISITGSMSGGNIEAGGGNDILHITNVSGADINCGAGDDILIAYINNPTAENIISGGKGNDSITITGTLNSNMTRINGAEGMDTIHVSNFAGGNHIQAGSDNDTILIDMWAGGGISCDAGDDKVIITHGNNGRVYGGDGNDTVVIENVIAGETQYLNYCREVEFFEFTNLNGGTIEGTSGDDSLTITHVSSNGGTYETRDGDDSITISTAFSSTVALTGSSDRITVDLHSSGTLKLEHGFVEINIDTIRGNVTIEAENDTWTQMLVQKIDTGASLTLTAAPTSTNGFNVTSQLGENEAVSILGTLHGSEIKDSITLGGDFAGTVHGHGGDDTFILEHNINAGTVHGGVGDDAFNFNAGTLRNATLHGDDGEDSFELSIVRKGTTIDGGNGADTITIDTAHGGIIMGGDGNDSITISDVVETPGEKVIIDAGAGQDTIHLSARNTISYVTIQNFNQTDDTLFFGGAEFTETSYEMNTPILFNGLFITFT